MCVLVNNSIAEAEAAWTELSKEDGGKEGCVTSGGRGSGSRFVGSGSYTICFYNLFAVHSSALLGGDRKWLKASPQKDLSKSCMY